MGAVGSMILDPLRVIPLAQRLRIGPDTFYVASHSVIVEILYDMVSMGAYIDILTVGEKLDQWKKGERIVERAYLDQCLDGTPTSAHAEYYLDLVRQHFIKRQTIRVARQVAVDAQCIERGDALLRDVPARFAEIIDPAGPTDSNRSVLEGSIAAWRAAKAGEKPAVGLQLPWDRLMTMSCGLEPGITIIAGRPSQGKTTLEDNISMYMAEEGIPVARVSLDASRKELLERAACRKSGVSLPKLKFGHASDAELSRIEDAKELIAEYPMWIAEQVDGVGDIRGLSTWVRMQKLKHDIQMVTIDYVQQIEASEMGWRADENSRLTMISRRLKALSLEFHIPVLLLSQLSREFEKTNTKRSPRLSDLRGSGSLEQDAHKIMFVYKDEDVAAELGMDYQKHKRPTWVDIQKNKDGETGAMEFWFMTSYFRFDPADPDFEDARDGIAGGKPIEADDMLAEEVLI